MHQLSFLDVLRLFFAIFDSAVTFAANYTVTLRRFEVCVVEK
jgi:hypothetical protein